jgi:hypothetical protein
MPCQCGSTTDRVNQADSAACDCASGSQSAAGCGCAGTTSPAPSDLDRSLERVVMELDKRVRSLEARR